MTIVCEPLLRTRQTPAASFGSLNDPTKHRARLLTAESIAPIRRGFGRRLEPPLKNFRREVSVLRNQALSRVSNLIRSAGTSGRRVQLALKRLPGRSVGAPVPENITTKRWEKQDMAKHPTEFAQGNVGVDWFRQIAEHNIRQSRASLEELLSVTRKMVDDLGSHASAVCEHSMSLSEETISNTFDYGVKMVRLREPREFAQAQSDYVSRQAQAIADQTKELNQRFMKAAEEMASTAAESARKQSKAA
jgi:hypothetical protein